MAKIRYVSRAFRQEKLNIIEIAESICDTYAEQGYNLTLRQLYYQFVATDAFPGDRRWSWTGTRWVRDPSGTKNAEPNYDWLGEIISDARLAGLIDWNHVEDRTRNVATWQTWESPGQMVRSRAETYSENLWETQPQRVEVWVEKEALADVIRRPCSRWQVSYFACKGYVSQSEMHSAAQRLAAYEAKDLEVTVIHLGDHDPSGIDMTRDISDRLELFGCSVYLADRIALNMDQILELNPPPSPAKITDSRAASYIERFGNDSWELDALDPATLDALVDAAIQEHLDRNLWDHAVRESEASREMLTRVADRWDDVAQFVADDNEE